MPTECVQLIGAGGHALVVIDALLALGLPREAIRLFDQDVAKVGLVRMGIVVALLNSAAMDGQPFHVCIGNNAARIALGNAMIAAGGRPHTTIHPAATVSSAASIGPGCFVAAGAVVAPLAAIDGFAIINHGAVVDHDCVLGYGCHVAPGAVLGGAVHVGRGVMVGAGAIILPGIHIADNAMIGAGAVVVRDVPAGAVQVGVPARDISQR